GRPVDAIPGLYGPKAFLHALDLGETMAKVVAPLEEAGRAAQLATLHEVLGIAADQALAGDLAKVKGASGVGAAPSDDASPSATEAAARAVGKSVVEAPILSAVGGKPVDPGSIDDATWKAIAVLHAEDARLDEGSVELLREKRPVRAEEAMRRTAMK